MNVQQMQIRKTEKQIQLDQVDAARDALAAEIDELNDQIRGHYAGQVDDGRPVRMEMVMEV